MGEPEPKLHVPFLINTISEDSAIFLWSTFQFYLKGEGRKGEGRGERGGGRGEKGEGRGEKGEGRRERGERREERVEGRRKRGEGSRERGEGRRERSLKRTHSYWRSARKVNSRSAHDMMQCIQKGIPIRRALFVLHFLGRGVM